MLFEREELTSKGRLLVLERLFEQAAARGGAAPEPGHVPVETLHAYGEFETHVRYLLEAAASQERNSLARKARLKKLEKALNTLPNDLMTSLSAGPDEHWLLFYRGLMKLLVLLDEAEISLDAEEYATVMQKMIQLAAAVSEASAVKVDAASMFALMLIQAERQRMRKPKAKRKARRRKRKASTRKPKAA